MCDAWDQTPSDTNPPEDVRVVFAQFVEARDKWNDAKVTDLTDYRRKRIMEQQLGLDLANAFRSPPARHPDDKEPA